MKEKFITRDLKPASITMVGYCNSIIREYAAQGYSLTLRQLYYQLVARALTENTQQAYKRIGDLVGKARLLGLIDWDAIEDRTRNLVSMATWNEPADILEACRDQYKEDLWSEQPYHVEVWVEKEALSGVIEKACYKYRIPYLACRGYMSLSEQYSGAKRMKAAEDAGQSIHVLHLGDHDPSGMDMTRDNRDRLRLLSNYSDVEVHRIALNMDQVEELNPPPNPAKTTDSRHKKYIAEFGGESWELDALEPSYIDNLIESEVSLLIDHDQWEADLERENHNRQKITNAIENLD